VVRDAFTFFKKRYFNAGMMLMNMPLIKKDDIFQKCRETIIKKCSYFFADQAVLNRIMTKRLMLQKQFMSLGKYYPEIIVHHFTNVRKK
jgi:lipopolysaccharide biosynthesis glycosyltransferase